MTTVKITDAGGGKPSFTQWDVDRVLYVTGVATQPMLHFSNPELKRALVVQPTLENGGWKCRVPNFILQFPCSFLVQVFVQADEGETIYTQLCRVAPKTKPQDYTYEENIGYVNWVQKTEEIQQMLEDGAFTPEFSIGAVTALATGEGATASITGTKPNPVLNLGLPKGDTGDPGVYIGSTQPTNPDVGVWIDTTGGADIEIHNVPAGGTSGQVLAKASGTDYDLEWTDQTGGSTITVDSALSDSSENPVQNKIIKAALDAKGTYSKPSGGIPATDLASGVIPAVPSAASTTPADLGTAVAGTSTKYARADHVHRLPSASEIGAIMQPFAPQTGDVLTWDGSAWLPEPPASVPSAYTSNPAALGTASAGSATSYARGDHVHPKPTAADIGAGTYSKPSGGIPASDLASAVQTSLGKADTALQSFTETDPTVPSWAKASSKPSYTASEVGAIAAPSSPSVGDFLVYTSNGWAAQSLSTWQASSY